jgi:plastocyanin
MNLRTLRLAPIALCALFATTACVSNPASGATPGVTPRTGTPNASPAPSVLPASPVPSPGSQGTGNPVSLGVVQGQLKFDKTSLSVMSGQTVDLVFANTDPALPHSFVIDQPRVTVPEDPIAGQPGGQTRTTIFRAPAPGSYEYYCAVPGHKEGGMVGRLEVTAP